MSLRDCATCVRMRSRRHSPPGDCFRKNRGSPMSATTLRTEMLCILYSDIVNSTPDGVQARKSGNDVALNELTQRFVELWRASLAPAGVSLFKPLGDGLLATFTDPLAALLAVLKTRAELDAQ